MFMAREFSSSLAFTKIWLTICIVVAGSGRAGYGSESSEYREYMMIEVLFRFKREIGQKLF